MAQLLLKKELRLLSYAMYEMAQALGGYEKFGIAPEKQTAAAAA